MSNAMENKKSKSKESFNVWRLSNIVSFPGFSDQCIRSYGHPHIDYYAIPINVVIGDNSISSLERLFFNVILEKSKEGTRSLSQHTASEADL